jgi:hypothetical protein
MVASNRKKQVSRRRVQKGGELTGESAMMKIQEREAKEKTQDEQRQYRAIQKIRIQEKKELHTRGVHARKIERFRRNILCDNRLDDIGIGHLRIPIPDPEKEAQVRENEGKQADSLPYSLPDLWEDGNPFDGRREAVEDSGFISLGDTSEWRV